MANGGKGASGASGAQAPAKPGEKGTPKEQTKHSRFSEPSKFLPVAFVASIIVGLFTIYMGFHIWPMFQFDVDPMLMDHRMKRRATWECVLFLYLTLVLVICYLKSILVHPGEIPDKDQDPSWQYVPEDGAQDAMNLQESKRSGERRYCKWCAKYKPDRCHHCRVCRTCILRMDHHCPWIYNCVGFRNHKYFFLLLLHSALVCHLIMWTMMESLKSATEVDTPFLTMFLLFFGETLAAFLGFLVTAFFFFHIWLMMNAMTTIEFCEKSLKKTGHNPSLYDQGPLGNIMAVLGPQPLLWLVPVSSPSGDGLHYLGERSRLKPKTMETGRGVNRRTGNKKATTGAKPQGAGDSGSDDAGDPLGKRVGSGSSHARNEEV